MKNEKGVLALCIVVCIKRTLEVGDNSTNGWGCFDGPVTAWMCFGGGGLAGVVVVAGSATVFDGGFVKASFPGTVMVQ